MRGHKNKKCENKAEKLRGLNQISKNNGVQKIAFYNMRNAPSGYPALI